MFYELEDTSKAAALFEGWDETIIWSCLEQVMGHVFVDDSDKPKSAMAMLGDFCFFAGEPNRAFVEFKPQCCKQGFMIMVPQTRAWGGLIELVYPKKLTKKTRYAIKKEPAVFDTKKLQRAIEDAPCNVTLRMIDKELFDFVKGNSWTRDWTSQYDSFEQYEALGALGVVLMKDGKVVSGASAYSVYKKGIEIEIDTKEEYRQNGYAYLCASKLILECLKRSKYPSWDAANLHSVALAEKLGYHFDHEYTVYEIVGY